MIRDEFTNLNKPKQTKWKLRNWKRWMEYQKENYKQWAKDNMEYRREYRSQWYVKRNLA